MKNLVGYLKHAFDSVIFCVNSLSYIPFQTQTSLPNYVGISIFLTG